MSADIMNRITIDLTGESDPQDVAPPSSDDPEVVFLSARPRHPPLRLPRPSRPEAQIPVNRSNAYSSADHPIIVNSDSDESDTEDELFGEPAPRRLPPPHEAFRIFSPPAQQFVPAPLPPRLPAGAARVDLERFFPRAEPAPPVYPPPPPPPRNRLGGGLIALRDRGPPARYHSQEANRRGRPHVSPPRPQAVGRQDRTYFDRFLDLLPGRRPQELPGNEWQWGAPVRMNDYARGPVARANLEGPWGDNWDDDLDLHPFGPGYFREFGGPELPYGYQNHHQRILRLVHNHEQPLAPQKPTYEPAWTHGRPKPRSGFTFDFEVSDASANTPIIIEDEPSHVASSSRSPPKTVTSLICPRCGNVLNMGARSVYALRCGHLVCTACYDDLSLPMVKPEPVEDAPVDIKGKGKAKEVVPEEPNTSPNRRNPRRKAATNPEPKNLRNSTTKATADSESRTPSKKRRRGPAMKEGQVLEQHMYACPVGDCVTPHYSVKVWSQNAKAPDGSKMSGPIWKPRDGDGAIPVFT